MRSVGIWDGNREPLDSELSRGLLENPQKNGGKVMCMKERFHLE